MKVLDGTDSSERLSVYDASYLELTRRDGVPLATLDKELVSAASAVGVALLGGTGA